MSENSLFALTFHHSRQRNILYMICYIFISTLHSTFWPVCKRHVHNTKQVLLCDLSSCILIHLHQRLGVRANGNNHAPWARELFHERRGDRPRGRADVNSLVGALLGVPEPPVASDEHDGLPVERGAEPVRADVRLRERGQRGHVLDPDDGAAVWADEPVEHAREVARACADVEDARAGAQIREEELGGMRVLFSPFTRAWAEGLREDGGREARTYHVWRRDGRIVPDRSR